MRIFIKGLIIGLGKIIPGVSGALLAINFNVYEPTIKAINNFFDNPKENLKLLVPLVLGIIIAIIFGSRLLLHLLNSNKYRTLMFFSGLIIGGTYRFRKNIKYNYKHIVIITFIIFLLLSLLNINNIYQLKHNYQDNLIFFLGGIIEIFASIVPGISATSLLMIIGIYENVLTIISNISNLSYVSENINLYLSYGLGMFISFVVNIKLINYLLKKQPKLTYSIILGLSLSSIIILLILTFKTSYTLGELIIGIVLMITGIYSSLILNK